MNDIPTVDMTIIQEMTEMLGGESFFEILGDFRDEIPNYRVNFVKFHDAQDVDSLIMLAHSIKSSSGNIGFPKISNYCKQIEEGLRENPNADMNELIANSQDELKKLVSEINNLIKQG